MLSTDPRSYTWCSQLRGLRNLIGNCRARWPETQEGSERMLALPENNPLTLDHAP